MMKRLIVFFCFILVMSAHAQVHIEDAFPTLLFEKPVGIYTPDDSTNRMFVVEQTGRIKVFQNMSSVGSYQTFLDLSTQIITGSELGLLGLAFHPHYKNNGYFYVNYTTLVNDTIYSRISRFNVSSTNPDSADKSSELILITVRQPTQYHNGGQTSFGPDGYLYLAFGDGGTPGDSLNNAQNKSSILGKILRINVDTISTGRNYGIPPDNPFAGNTQGWREEIFTLGMRNPWRFSFDIVTGWLWCADVGQNTWEEIDLLQKGGNYGWRCYEASHPYNLTGCNDTYINPIWEYDHSNGNCAITGGFVYRGSSIPDLYGKYIYADYCSKNYWTLRYDSSAAPVNTFLLNDTTITPVSFGVDLQNELYVCAYEGKIYKFKPGAVNVQETVGKLDFSLQQNYPNPFNPSTKINYTLAEESNLKVEILNILGMKVAELFSGNKSAGEFELTWNAFGLSSGIYFIRIIAQSIVSGKEFNKIIKAAYIK